jgi:hypothetical protein
VWGTDRYSSDSSLCAAAVHAGVIGLDAGGTITVRLAQGGPEHVGTVRHGMRSQSSAPTNRSFTFVR